MKPDAIEFRLYQNDIAEGAIERNTLVVLPTALGKTTIAILAATKILCKRGGGKVLVMAPTRPLVLQHQASFAKVLRLDDEDLVAMTGQLGPTHRRQVWESKAKIIFATPQIVRNDVRSGILSLRNYALLVFDEAHRSRKDYAYPDVARSYVNCSPYPLILGLTASPGSNRVKINELCKSLFIEHIEFRTEDDDDVKPYINPVEVTCREVDLPKEYCEMRDLLRLMLYDRLNWLNEKGVIRKDPRYIFKSDLLELGDVLRRRLNGGAFQDRGLIYAAIVVQAAALTLYHALELLESQGLQTLQPFLEKVDKEDKRSHSNISKDPRYGALKDLATRHSGMRHPKTGLLMEVLETQIEERPDSKVLVFTQYRDTASYLVNLLESSGIRAKRFVGQASRLEDQGLTQEEQMKILEEFRKGDIRVLVATSIGEEGLDIAECNLVVFYEPIPSEIRYIQRKGRTGRRAPGKTVLLVTKDSLDEVYLHSSKRRAEAMRIAIRRLNKSLNKLERSEPSPEPNSLSESGLKADAGTLSVDGTGAQIEATEITEKKIDRMARKVYTEAAKAGRKGLTMDDFAFAQWDAGLLDEAVKKLEKMEQLTRIDGKLVLTANSKPVDGRVLSLCVEKVMPRCALVTVDGTSKALLNHYDYSGPQQLLRRGAEFKVVGALYYRNGELNVRVKQILESL